MTQTQSRKKNLFQMNVDLMHGPISVSYTHLADLVGTAFQHPVKVLQRVDAAAHGEWDEYLAGHPGEDLSLIHI